MLRRLSFQSVFKLVSHYFLMKSKNFGDLSDLHARAYPEDFLQWWMECVRSKPCPKPGRGAIRTLSLVLT